MKTSEFIDYMIRSQIGPSWMNQITTDVAVEAFEMIRHSDWNQKNIGMHNISVLYCCLVYNRNIQTSPLY